MPNVDHRRPEYEKALTRWDMVDDCDSGQDAIIDGGDKYLPRPNPIDKSNENRERYDQYLKRAVWYGITKRTLDGLVGQVFAEDPEIKLPPQVELFAVDDIDGNGLTLIQQSKDVLRSVLKKGRKLMLVDFPDSGGEVTQLDIITGAKRPTICVYEPQSVINWSTTRVGSQTLTSLIVIKEVEEYYEDGDPFAPKTKDRFRVLELIEGVYTISIWERSNAENGQIGDFALVGEPVQPTDGIGNTWRYIPAVFCGSKNNDPCIDDAPIYEIATLNVGHWRNSADYEESCFLTGQPTLAISTELDSKQFNEANSGGVSVGARGGIYLGMNGKAELLQCAANSMPFEAMQHKERQMVSLGAKIVEQREVQRTASEAKMSNASETSVLASVAKNVSDAYRQCIAFAVKFVDGTEISTDDIEFELNTEYDVAAFASDMLRELNSAWVSGGVTDYEYRANLRRAFELEDDEEWQENRTMPRKTQGVTIT